NLLTGHVPTLVESALDPVSAPLNALSVRFAGFGMTDPVWFSFDTVTSLFLALGLRYFPER
ncbi:hypothetical protein BaRGS_00030653, partial [Batillaria attramentaria]